MVQKILKSSFDVVLKMDSKTWAGLYLSAFSLEDAMENGTVSVTGNKADAVEVFDMLDKFKPAQNYMVPPIED